MITSKDIKFEMEKTKEIFFCSCIWILKRLFTLYKLVNILLKVSVGNRTNDVWIDSIKKGNYWCIKALLENGYNFHEYDEWSLRWVCYYGHYRIAKLLIKHGADVDEALYWAKKPPPDLKVIKWLEEYKTKIRK